MTSGTPPRARWLKSTSAASAAVAEAVSSGWSMPRSPAKPQQPQSTGTCTCRATEPSRLLPTTTTLIEREGGLWWDDGKGSSYRIVAVDDKGLARLDTEIGAVTVPRKLIADARTDALSALPKLVAQAQSGKAKAGRWTLEIERTQALQPDPLTGWAGGGETAEQVQLFFPDAAAAQAYAAREGLTAFLEKRDPVWTGR